MEHNWVLYEFNRALCRIEADENFKQRKKSSVEIRKQIVEDLKIACTEDFVGLIVAEEPKIRDWMTVNAVEEQEIGLGT